jgi:glutamyl-tRNA reductase
MLLEEKKTIDDFWIIGINFRKSNAALRSQYALNDEEYTKLLAAAPSFGLSELFVLSTCNRAEIYGFAMDPLQLSSLLCHFTAGNEKDFLQQAYQKKGTEALAHIYNVAAGIDSQILGDYEIIGQLKKAFYLSRENGCTGAFTDRLFKSVLQSCRAVRSETNLSGGTVSVAYAAIRFLKNNAEDLNHKKVLVAGMGKIGQNTCKNLVKLTPPENITLINRTDEKAIEVAEKLQFRTAPYAALEDEIRRSDIIIVATNAPTPIITRHLLSNTGPKILIDLSIPNNIDPAVQELPGIVLANVDDLSRINDETLRQRRLEVPKATALINFYIHDFAEWYMMRQNVPVLKAVKEKLEALNEQLSEARQQHDTQAIQKTLNAMAVKLKGATQKPGCCYIEAIKEYVSEAVN